MHHKDLQAGCLVYYKLNHKSESTIDKTRTGLVVEVLPKHVTGYRFARVLWLDTEETEEVAVNYLHSFEKSD